MKPELIFFDQKGQQLCDGDNLIAGVNTEENYDKNKTDVIPVPALDRQTMMTTEKSKMTTTLRMPDEPEQGNNKDDGGNYQFNALCKVQCDAEDHVHIDAPVPDNANDGNNGNNEHNIKPNQANEIDPNELTTDAKTNDADNNTDNGEDNDEPNLQ